jgi:hypothetical protein
MIVPSNVREMMCEKHTEGVLAMSSMDIMNKVQVLKDIDAGSYRIGVTELARNPKWRETLPELGVMQIMDRKTTAGWLISDAEMDEICADLENYKKLMREQEEAETVRTIIETRQGEALSGQELIDAAMKIFEEKYDVYEEALNVY